MNQTKEEIRKEREEIVSKLRPLLIDLEDFFKNSDKTVKAKMEVIKPIYLSYFDATSKDVKARAEDLSNLSKDQQEEFIEEIKKEIDPVEDPRVIEQLDRLLVEKMSIDLLESYLEKLKSNE